VVASGWPATWNKNAVSTGNFIPLKRGHRRDCSAMPSARCFARIRRPYHEHFQALEVVDDAHRRRAIAPRNVGGIRGLSASIINRMLAALPEPRSSSTSRNMAAVSSPPGFQSGIAPIKFQMSRSRRSRSLSIICAADHRQRRGLGRLRARRGRELP
jgi:hypothetical protein